MSVRPMFAQNIGWIAGPREGIETDNFGGNGFPDAMKRKCVVAFVEFGMRLRQTIDDRLIVAEHVAFSSDRNAEITQSIT